MTDRQQLALCLDRLHLADDTELLDKARHFLARCTSKIDRKIFKAGPNCRHVVCIQLAFESLGRTGWDTAMAAKLATCTKRAYENTVSLVRTQLGVQQDVTFESMAVTFGCTTMVNKLEDLWQTFCEKYVTQLGSYKRSQTMREELDQPAVKAAVFLTCARSLGHRIDKAKLLRICFCNSRQLTTWTDAIEEVCSDELKELEREVASPSPLKRSWRRTGQQDETKADEEEQRVRTKKPKAGERKAAPAPANKKAVPVSGIVSMIGQQNYKETRRYKDYIQWRRQMLQKLSA